MEEKRILVDKFMLRLPDGMRDRIKIAAEQNNRSMNAEIVATLERKYPKDSGMIRVPAEHLNAMLELHAFASDTKNPEKDRRIADAQYRIMRKMIEDGEFQDTQ